MILRGIAVTTALNIASRGHLMEPADYPMILLDYGTRNAAVNPKLLGFVDSKLNPQSRFLSFKDSAS